MIFVDNLLNNKTIPLLNLAEYRLKRFSQVGLQPHRLSRDFLFIGKIIGKNCLILSVKEQLFTSSSDYKVKLSRLTIYYSYTTVLKFSFYTLNAIIVSSKRITKMFQCFTCVGFPPNIPICIRFLSFISGVPKTANS